MFLSNLTNLVLPRFWYFCLCNFRNGIVVIPSISKPVTFRLPVLITIYDETSQLLSQLICWSLLFIFASKHDWSYNTFCENVSLVFNGWWNRLLYWLFLLMDLIIRSFFCAPILSLQILFISLTPLIIIQILQVILWWTI